VTFNPWASAILSSWDFGATAFNPPTGVSGASPSVTKLSITGASTIGEIGASGSAGVSCWAAKVVKAPSGLTSGATSAVVSESTSGATFAAMSETLSGK
jgi:hypothetical protein